MTSASIKTESWPTKVWRVDFRMCVNYVGNYKFARMWKDFYVQVCVNVMLTVKIEAALTMDVADFLDKTEFLTLFG